MQTRKVSLREEGVRKTGSSLEAEMYVRGGAETRRMGSERGVKGLEVGM